MCPVKSKTKSKEGKMRTYGEVKDAFEHLTGITYDFLAESWYPMDWAKIDGQPMARVGRGDATRRVASFAVVACNNGCGYFGPIRPPNRVMADWAVPSTKTWKETETEIIDLAAIWRYIP